MRLWKGGRVRADWIECQGFVLREGKVEWSGVRGVGGSEGSWRRGWEILGWVEDQF